MHSTGKIGAILYKGETRGITFTGTSTVAGEIFSHIVDQKNCPYLVRKNIPWYQYYTCTVQYPAFSAAL